MTKQTNSFEQAYPSLTRWIKHEGWVELGHSEDSRSLVRVVDDGGLIWEGETRYPSLDQALATAEKALKEWIEENLSDDTEE